MGAYPRGTGSSPVEGNVFGNSYGSGGDYKAPTPLAGNKFGQSWTRTRFAARGRLVTEAAVERHDVMDSIMPG